MRLLRRFAFAFAFLAVAVWFLPVASPAQSNATIHFAVTDPTGAAVANTTIEIESLVTHARVTETRHAADGTFSLNLSPGSYRIKVSAEGFLEVSNEVTITAGASQQINARLPLATMSSNVIVSAQAEALPTDEVIAPVDVITRQDIDNEHQIFITPLLATVPGIAFSQLGPEGGVVSLFLDGGNSNYTRVLVDGVPQDVSLSGISIDLSDYTSDAIDKIEVVHGATSALYGSDAMTGVVDVLTHRGTTTTPQLILQGEGGTFDTGRGSGQLSGMLGKFDYSAAASYFSTRGQSPGAYVLENDGPQTYPFLRETALSGNFGWKFSDTDTLRLTVRNSSSDAGQPGQTLLASNPNVEFDPVVPDANSGLHNFSSGLSWNLASGEHWQTHVQGFDSRYQDSINEPFFEFFAVDKFNRAGLDARSTYSYSHGSVTAGYDFENETGGAFGRHDNAGYIEARYQFTRRLTAIAGGRVEANDSFGTRLVPRVGAAYVARYGAADRVWGATKLRASYGQGIKEPPLFPSDCTPILKPEQATTFDAGIDQDIDSGRMRFSATLFRNDFHNIVSFESLEDPSQQNCPAFFGSYFNTDKARAFGTDSSFSLRAARWLNLGGTYSYDDSKVLDSPNATDPALVPGNRLLKRPLNSANLFLNARYRGVNWNVTGYFVGRRTDSDFLGLGITSNPGYVRWDTSVLVPLHYGISLTAHFQNLFDKHYQDAIGYPALGYNYLIGLRYVWGGDR
jgi:vitamin B12 transporter